ncbi:MAG: TonB-dependent receptor [Dysgonamonadaceae bacterium]|jgi:TonB-linked SusC/RagA family outer membrane protein|nr:TonB-dependent receptor [Dysgonamonadaceae bacterium]
MIKKTGKHSILLLIMLLLCSLSMSAQRRNISGTVTEAATGEPVIGASVHVKGTSIGVSTDIEGKFKLSVPEDGKILVIDFLGYVSQELPINTDVFNIALKDDAADLDEVVVIGYGTMKKRDLTGAVSSVSSKEITARPVASIGEALSGRMAGVQVTTAEGSPDAEITIRVRGGGSITQSNEPLYIVDGFPVSSISDISPNEIASIDVLKDASSTAIYGSRGANGVIIITTKSGDSGKVRVNYDGYFGPKQIARRMDVLEPYDFALWQYELALLKGDWTKAPDDVNSGYTSRLGNYDDIDLYRNFTGNDWLDLTFGRVGHTSNHSLNIAGGSDQTKYSFNYTRYDEKAIMYGSKFSRDNLAFKLNNKPTKRVGLDFSARWSQTRINGSGVNDGGNEKGSTTEGRLRNAMIYSPIPIVGTLSSDDDTDAAANLYDPILSINDNDRYQVRNVLNLNGAFNWELIDNLTFRSEIGYNLSTSNDNRFYGLTTYFVQQNTVPTNKPAIIFTDKNANTLRNANTLSYDFKGVLPEAHHLSIMAGHEVSVTKNITKSSEVDGLDESFTLDQAMALQNHDDGSRILFSNSYSPDDKILSFFGRLNYDYLNKYLLSATLRADGSSKFSDENRWGYFPSASAAWRISAEPWMDGAHGWLNDLKLRLSYGTAGNNNIPSGLITQLYETKTTSWLSGFASYWAPSGTMANPNLKWETTITRNVGLDLSLFSGRFSATIDAYRNTTKDLLLLVLQSGTGYQNKYKNQGSTQNQGAELTLNWIALQKKDYGLSFSFNVGHNENKIIDLGERGDFYEHTDAFGSGSGGVYNDYAILVGGAVGQMWGYKSDGMYTVDDFEGYNSSTGKWILKDGVVNSSAVVGDLRPGKMKLQDLDGDGVVKYGSDEDKTVIGNANPNLIGGFTVNANAYGFDLGVNFNYSIGNDVYNANKMDYTQTHKYTFRNMITDMESGKRWTDLDVATGTLVNDPVKLAEMNATTTTWSPYVANYVFSDYYVEDGSFLRLNTLTLGYTVPKAVISKLKIQNLRVYCSAYNLALWTNYSGFDPEVSTRRKSQLTPGVDFSSYPRAKSVVFGLNLTF